MAGPQDPHLDELAARLPAPPGDPDPVEAWARWAHGCLADNPRRWEHVCGMWRQVRRWRDAGEVEPELAGMLERAVLAHDTGYMVDARRHAQVAARALQLAGVDEAVVSSVAHHNRSEVLARRRGLGSDYATLAPLGGTLDDAMTLLDATTGPDGQPMGVRARWSDVAARYGTDSVEAAEVLAAEAQVHAGADALGVARTPAPDRTLLVCDLGGVITSGDGRQELGAALRALGGDERLAGPDGWGALRHQFWSGELTVHEAAGALCADTTLDAGELARCWDTNMLAAVQLLERAAEALEGLARKVPVWVLSNHRSGWLAAVSVELGPLVDRWWVSDRTGTAKPDPAAFEMVERAWDARCALDGVGGSTRIVYVDDQARNLAAGAARGWEVVDGSAPRWWDQVSEPVGRD